MSFNVYKARDGWRWRGVARNGRIVADSGEAYTTKYSALYAAERMVTQILDGMHSFGELADA